MLRIYTHTATEARGQYARICVQVNVSKPLITSVRIRQRNQAVVYEGVNKLCFSCDPLGHQRETCQYTIKPPAPSPKDSHVPSDAEKIDQTAAAPVVLIEAQTEARGTLENGDSDAAFGP